MANNPILRIPMLKLFLSRDKLSKTQVMKELGRKDHGNISKACDDLIKDGMIKLKDTHFGSGRPEKFYRITEKGIVFTIKNSVNSEEFWTALMFSAYYHGNLVNWNKILNLLDLYLKKYLKYYQKEGVFFFQLDEFNVVCESWFKKAIHWPNKISAAQKILEVLAVKPNLTLKQIAQECRESNSITDSVVKMYTGISHRPVLVDARGHFDGIFYDTSEWRFKIHQAIIQSQASTGTKTLSLSLFGIILVLYIIMKDYEGKLTNGLLYDYELQKYFDIIANNYRTNIPLIFGKWSLLKSNLGENSCHNFNMIMDKVARDASFQDSIVRGGNHELYFGLKKMIMISQKQLIDLATTAMKVIFNFSPVEGYTINPQVNFDRAAVSQKTRLVFILFQYLNTIIQPTAYDEQSFFSMATEEGFLGPEIAKEFSSFHNINYLEKGLALEITLLYYLSLKNDNKIIWIKSKPVQLGQIFSQLLDYDESIAMFMNEHLGRIATYLNEVHNLLESIKLKKSRN